MPNRETYQRQKGNDASAATPQRRDKPLRYDTAAIFGGRPETTGAGARNAASGAQEGFTTLADFQGPQDADLPGDIALTTPNYQNPTLPFSHSTPRLDPPPTPFDLSTLYKRRA